MTLLGPTSYEANQKSGDTLEKNGLADHEQDGNAGIAVTMILFEALQPCPEIMQDQKKIRDHEHGIDHELNQECAQSLGRFFSHVLRVIALKWKDGRVESDKKSNSIARLELSP